MGQRRRASACLGSRKALQRRRVQLHQTRARTRRGSPCSEPAEPPRRLRRAAHVSTDDRQVSSSSAASSSAARTSLILGRQDGPSERRAARRRSAAEAGWRGSAAGPDAGGWRSGADHTTPLGSSLAHPVPVRGSRLRQSSRPKKNRRFQGPNDPFLDKKETFRTTLETSKQDKSNRATKDAQLTTTKSAE